MIFVRCGANFENCIFSSCTFRENLFLTRILYDIYIAKLRRLSFMELYISNFIYATSKRSRLHMQLAKFAFKLAHRVLEYVVRYYNSISARSRIDNLSGVKFHFPLMCLKKKITRTTLRDFCTDLCQ